MNPLTVPDPEPTDSSSVSETLLAARSELARAEPREALRLLRQAAEAAEEAGNDVRALTLARAAADLANEMGASRPPPPSHIPPPSQVAPPSHIPPPSQVAPPSHIPPPSQVTPPVVPASPVAPASSIPAAPLSREGVEPELAALVASGRAVRVLVKRSTRDEELYVVRRPVNGKPVYDAREAVIILLEPDAEFFGAGASSPSSR